VKEAIGNFERENNERNKGVHFDNSREEK